MIAVTIKKIIRANSDNNIFNHQSDNKACTANTYHGRQFSGHGAFSPYLAIQIRSCSG